METLELKIFDVLVGNITIEVFEKWLYQSKFLEERLKADSLIFEIVNINYRSDDSLKKLKNIADEVFDEKDLLAMKIETNCEKISNTDVNEDIEKYVWNIIEDYNFDIEPGIYWEFYNLYHSFDGFEFTKYSKRSLDDISLRTKVYAKTVLANLRKCNSIEDKKQVLFSNVCSKEDVIIEKNTVAKTKKISLKNRITSLFKKINFI